MTAIITPNLTAAAPFFFNEPYRFVLIGPSSGFSGSNLAHITDSSGLGWCLRAWPPETDPERLAFIHQVLSHSRANGFSGLPRLKPTLAGPTFLTLGDHLFDAQEWLAGAPPGPKPGQTGPTPNELCPLSQSLLVELAAALARFHRSSTGLPQLPGAEWQPLIQRLAESIELEQERQELLQKAICRRQDDYAHLSCRWLKLLPQTLTLAQQRLATYPTAAQAVTTLCHGDLWAPHVYFNGSTFSGFVDFETLAFSSPAFDLAQLILHFGGWPTREIVLRAYQSHQSLSQADQAVLPAAAALDLAGEAYWSLDRLYAQQDGPAQQQAHLANLQGLLPSLELIAAELSA
jgi:Ser/Thr protein kinase RdoA (MazF antagonist)